MAGSEINEIRLANTLKLFEIFKEVVAPGSPDLRGLERRFAQNIGISPSYWAQIKSPQRLKGIGRNLARQFERSLRMPVGWLDQVHDPDAPVPLRDHPEYKVIASTLEEKEFLEAALEFFRNSPNLARERLEQ